ncbi:MAG TPA: alpha/beta hydrolase-fold protein [Chitinophagaceae bacterium]|jgi:hypothetical protein
MKRLPVLALAFFLFNTISKGQQTGAVPDVKSKPFVLGEIVEIPSQQLSEKRVLNIYLPEGYRQDDTTRYSVIYLLDGSADEDFIHIAGLVQYLNFPWINTLPKLIVVGIANVDRRRDFTFPTTVEKDKKDYPTTGSSRAFIAFIEKELQPFIERRYRVNQSKTIIGQSLAGLLAAEILLEKPSLFSTYIIISPSLWWDNGSLLSKQAAVLQPGFNQPTAIYVGVGKEGSMPGKEKYVMEDQARQLADKLSKAGNKNTRVYFDYLPKETHATIEHPAVFNAFRLLYPAPAH